MQEVNLEVVRGDTISEIVQFKTAEDVAINISNWTELTAKIKDVDGNHIESFDIAQLDVPNGIIELTLADTITAEMLGAYTWDFQRNELGNIKTMMGGFISVTADVTMIGA